MTKHRSYEKCDVFLLCYHECKQSVNHSVNFSACLTWYIFICEPNDDNIIQRLFWAAECFIMDCFSRTFSRHFFKPSSWWKWSTRHQAVLLGALNDESVAGLFGLVPARLPTATFSSVHVHARVHYMSFLWLQSVWTLNIHISQGSVVTRMRWCDGIVNEPFCKFPKECASKRTFKINQYLANIWARVWCLLF